MIPDTTTITLNIPVKVSSSNFFKSYVKCLNPLLNLRDREAEMLESFLKVHYKNKHLPNVNELLFSFPSLNRIRQSLNMSRESFNNHRMQLRRKQVFIGHSINENLIRYPKNGKLTITYNIELTDAKDNKTGGYNQTSSKQTQSDIPSSLNHL